MSNFAVRKIKYLKVRMKTLAQYMIPFSGLKCGEYHFDFEITNSFFELTAFPDVRNGELSASVDLHKQETMMIFQIQISGNIELMCDRCLDFFNYPLIINEQLIVKQVIEPKESDDDSLIYIDVKEHSIDFSHLFYEYISVAIPIKHCHPDDKNGQSACNKEMIEKLANYAQNQSVSQWDTLRDLTQDKN